MKRFDIFDKPSFGFGTKDDGKYVLYTDHLAALEAAVKEKDATIQESCKIIAEGIKVVEGLEEQITALETSDAGMLRAINEGLVEEGKIQAEQIAALTDDLAKARTDEDSLWKERDALTAENKRQAEEIVELRNRLRTRGDIKTDRVSYEEDAFKQEKEWRDES